MLGVLFSSLAFSATYYVAPTPTGTGDGTSTANRGEIITTIKKTVTGDIVYIAPGTYTLDATKVQPLNTGAYIRIPKDSSTPAASNIVFIGESDNPEDVRIIGDPATKRRIFYFAQGGHTLRNLLISGGYTAYQGAGICMPDNTLFYADPSLAFTASNCVVENCSALYQGANRGGLWRDCVIRNNEVRSTDYRKTLPITSEGSGGGVFNATLYNCVITNNTAGYCGGGIAGGTMTGLPGESACYTKAYNCLIGWNSSANGGGAGASEVMTGRTYCQLYDCTVVSNLARYMVGSTSNAFGGGAFLCTISNSVIRGNSSLRSGNHTDGKGNGAGGGVRDCTVTDSLIKDNTSIMGGAGASSCDLVRCAILNNCATGTAWNAGYGGGTHACPRVEDCLIAGNSGHYGGAGFNGSFDRCVMTNNQATVVDGGATYNATSRNCVVVGNYAARYYAHCRGAHYGDLVYANRNGTVNGTSGIGQDIANTNEPLPVVNCTVWNNLNGSAEVSRASVTNSIMTSVLSLKVAVNSFWRSGTGPANAVNCISGTDKDPKFAGVKVTDSPSTDVPWAAYALLASSPCRDAGVTLAGQTAETDLLGNPRVKFDGVDMGALELFTIPGLLIKLY